MGNEIMYTIDEKHQDDTDCHVEHYCMQRHPHTPTPSRPSHSAFRFQMDNRFGAVASIVLKTRGVMQLCIGNPQFARHKGLNPLPRFGLLV